MALIQVFDNWIPTKVHGSVEVPSSGLVDVEAIVAAALKNLLSPSQIPGYTDIKYRFVLEKTTADENGSTTTTAGAINTLFFELI